MTLADERQLIRRAQQGDTAAFEQLVQMHAPFVYNLARRTVSDPHEADDIAQETFLRAWRGIGRFKGGSQLRTWLYRITTNLCYTRLPRMKADLAALDVDESLPLTARELPVEDQIADAELGQLLSAAIAELSECYRLLIVLRHIQGLSYDEIAEITNLPLGTVKTGIFRGRKQLKQILSERL